jgi:hypothetical protein
MVFFSGDIICSLRYELNFIYIYLEQIQSRLKLGGGEAYDRSAG